MPHIAILGSGPAGLMAAEKLSAAGCAVTVIDQKTSPGRKFLMAGRGGLNLTKDEPFDAFCARYGEAADWMRPRLQAFSPTDVREWVEGLGIPTFVGSSGRIFPKSMKATPLLRAWLERLTAQGVRFLFRRRWIGNLDLPLRLDGPEGEEKLACDACILALGGGSWARLGSDGAWVSPMQVAGIDVSPLRPSNCGFLVHWTPRFAQRFAGQPIKPVILSFEGRSQQGEIMITSTGIEGGVVYAFASALREKIAEKGSALLHLDLRPGLTVQELSHRISERRGRLSFSNLLRKRGGLPDVAAGLFREALIRGALALPPTEDLAALIKACPVWVEATTGLDRAISSAGGVKLGQMDSNQMLIAKPGFFLAGEMLDWEAPTGGYLLQGCFSTGVAAASGALRWAKARGAVSD